MASLNEVYIKFVNVIIIIYSTTNFSCSFSSFFKKKENEEQKVHKKDYIMCMIKSTFLSENDDETKKIYHRKKYILKLRINILDTYCRILQ